MPSSLNYITVFFTGTSCTCRKNLYLKPWVILKKESKTLTNHTCCTDNTNFKFLLIHNNSSE